MSEPVAASVDIFCAAPPPTTNSSVLRLYKDPADVSLDDEDTQFISLCEVLVFVAVDPEVNSTTNVSSAGAPRGLHLHDGPSRRRGSEEVSADPADEEVSARRRGDAADPADEEVSAGGLLLRFFPNKCCVPKICCKFSGEIRRISWGRGDSLWEDSIGFIGRGGVVYFRGDRLCRRSLGNGTRFF